MTDLTTYEPRHRGPRTADSCRADFQAEGLVGLAEKLGADLASLKALTVDGKHRAEVAR